MSRTSIDLEFRPVPAEHVDKAFELESTGFPADEAASLEMLRYRQRVAGPLFLGAYTPDGELVGFACATLTPSDTLTHDSLSRHVANAPYAAIHSVCVSTRHRRQGIARSLLDAYVAHLARLDGIRGARLITHHHLISLYSQAGFELVGGSSVVHGSEKWFEMRIDLIHRPNADQRPQDDEDETSIRNPGTKFSSLGSTPLAELVDTATEKNKAELFCPRAECRCLLVKRGVARLVRSRPDEFELPSLPQPIDGPTLRAVPAESWGYWSLSSPLAFENIGFSGNAPPPRPSLMTSAQTETPSIATSAIKYLICADCDIGPLGWHDTEGRDLGVEVAQENEGQTGNVRSGREFLLAVDRIRYRVADGKVE
ncbi:BQ2448_2377 [Microbotryum intermedium]|uniref:BQ2448_2377 protein n=1 Tax=Microbotryum intermedium TaxID=269621 RepID=A0A238F887_9BASI|nr:BQ2448_2377 [Microbotryum intermedium]